MSESANGRPRLVVMISGSGTNLQALINAVQRGELDAEIVAVVSNRKEAFGLQRAAQAQIETLYFPLKPYKEQGLSREAYDADLAARVGDFEPDLIVLAGWMYVLSQDFLCHFPDQVINLHPALPGAFPGLNAIERTFEAYQKGEVEHGGVMIHYVVPEVDAGLVIAEAVVPIIPEDSLETFTARLHGVEHELIVTAVKTVISSQ
jgi:formyltetrahydrofolate-dependent phosphoribosylglycinamide formyltransferase